MRGLSQDTPVIWIDPDNNEISESDTGNYVIEQGFYMWGSKTSGLTVKSAKLATFSSGDVLKCKVRSDPDLIKKITLTVPSQGKLLVHFLRTWTFKA